MRAERWPLAERDISAMMNDLCFDYFKWDVDACGRRLVLSESVVLTRHEHERVVAICERFSRLLEKLEKAILAQPHFLNQLGIPPDIIPLLQMDQPEQLQLARYDVFQTMDGRWMLSEFNEDVPGGFNEAHGVPELLGPHLRGTAFHGNLRDAIVEALRPFEHVPLLYATGYAEDLQHMLIVKKWLEDEGHTTELASPSHIRAGWRGPEIFGRKCDAAFRFYPGEWFQWLDNLKDWRKVVSRLPMMNPLRRLIRQSKRLYAIWNHPDLLDRKDREFLADHTPATLAFDPNAPINDRSRWVLKNAFGRMGDTVIMGNLANDKDWADALTEARKKPGEWLLQERFDVAKLQDGGKPIYPGLGVYLVNHKFAGYYSRAAHHPFINHEAYHVATLVETV
ncbi:MAG TPA: glutathionylspermidine synthase family protein [Kiritimatiellia bacterium]|nr:glutathionylspermidine synthase family protein [Kiritimatiellia bacterium]